MDEQRLEEIARKAKGQIQAALPLFECSSPLAYLNIMASVLEAVKVAIREALASPSGVCDECGNPLVPSEATWYHRECDLKRDEAKEEQLRSLREERDAARTERDAEHAWACAASLEERTLRARAESAEAELQRLREGMRRLGSGEAFTDAMSLNASDPRARAIARELTARMNFACAALASLEPLPDPVEAFVLRVNARAEAEMLKTHKLEGAHKRALDAEHAAYRVK